MKLERLQNYARRVILKEHRVTSATCIRIELNWSTLKKRRHLHIATLMFKVINEMGPDYLASLYTPASKIHNHDTRAAASGVLHLPRTAGKLFHSVDLKFGILYHLRPDSYRTCMLLLFLHIQFFLLISYVIILSIILLHFAIHVCLPLHIYS